MKFTKKDIEEIVDSDNELIGNDSTPNSGSNLETQANNTTDYNAKVGHQPYRYDMLGRFGFTLLPFFEGEGEEVETPNPIIEALAAQLFEFYKEILEKYYRNPQKLKSDFRKISKQDYETGDPEFGFEAAEKIFNAIKPHFEEAFKELDDSLKNNIDENSFIEGKMLDDKKDRKDVVDRKKSNDVLDKEVKTRRIADLINKLNKDDVKKIKNLLEAD